MTKEHNVGLGAKIVAAAVALGVLSSPTATDTVLGHAGDAFTSVRSEVVAELDTVRTGHRGDVSSNHSYARPAHRAANSYRFTVRDDSGRPGRWNPCAPIPLLVNLDNAPVGAMRDLKAAARRVNRASGLDFTVVGTTDATPTRSWGLVEWQGNPGGWAPVLVAFGTPGTGDLARDGSSGVASPVWVGHDGVEVFVSGSVVFNSNHNDRYRPGFGDGMRRGELYTHELGHLAGLDHVRDLRQIMYPEVGHADDLGAGDRAGLAAVGAAAGCLDVPEPSWAR